METHGEMKVFRYEDSKEEVWNETGSSIFLAGPTVRGNQPHLTSWRFEAIEILKKKNYKGSVFIPEFISKTESDKGKDWIPKWEYNGLKRACCVLFWIPRTRELIGLTTNWEHGFWMGRNLDKVVYGRPDEAYRIGYIDTMWNTINEEIGHSEVIFNTLEATIDASIIRANQIAYVRAKADM